MVEHLLSTKQQAHTASPLEHLLHKKGLYGNLGMFLLDGEANNHSPYTLANRRILLTRFIGFCKVQGAEDAGAISLPLLQMFLISLRSTCNPTSVHDYYRAVRRFLNWCVEQNIINANPADKLKPPRVEKKIIQPFTAQHIHDMLLLCDANTFLGSRNRALILLFLDTGLRLKEMAEVQLNSINANAYTIKVMGKGAKERIVAFSKPTMQALVHYLAQRADTNTCLWVTEERRPLTHRGISIMFRYLKDRAGITDVRVSAHTLRHTFGTLCLKNGATVFQLQSLLGHSTLEMTKRYTASLNSEEAVLKHSRFSPVSNLKL